MGFHGEMGVIIVSTFAVVTFVFLVDINFQLGDCQGYAIVDEEQLITTRTCEPPQQAPAPLELDIPPVISLVRRSFLAFFSLSACCVSPLYRLY